MPSGEFTARTGFTKRVRKIGGSLGLLLGSQVCGHYNIQEGDEIEFVTGVDPKLILIKVKRENRKVDEDEWNPFRGQ